MTNNYIKLRASTDKHARTEYVFFDGERAEQAYRRAYMLAVDIGGAYLSVWRSVRGVPGSVPLVGESITSDDGAADRGWVSAKRAA